MKVHFADGHEVLLRHDGQKLVMSRPNQLDSIAPFPSRSTGDLLAEELRRLDPDESFADAVGAVTGLTGLNDRNPVRTHIWHDPAMANEV